AGKKSAQIREILISESAWEEMTCLFAPSLTISLLHRRSVANAIAIPFAPPPTTPDYITIKTKFGRI
ncbi:hypothetical protein L1Q52_24790, partial [Klebsiella pneumoniae]